MSTDLYISLPLSLGFILPHSPSSKASLAAATALSTSLTWAKETSQMAYRTNRWTGGHRVNHASVNFHPLVESLSA